MTTEPKPMPDGWFDAKVVEPPKNRRIIVKDGVAIDSDGNEDALGTAVVFYHQDDGVYMLATYTFAQSFDVKTFKYWKEIDGVNLSKEAAYNIVHELRTHPYGNSEVQRNAYVMGINHAVEALTSIKEGENTDIKYTRAEPVNRQIRDEYTPKFAVFDRVKLSHRSKYQDDWKDAYIIIGEVKYNRKLGRVEYAIYDMNEPVDYGFTDGFLEHELEHYIAAEKCQQDTVAIPRDVLDKAISELSKWQCHAFPIGDAVNLLKPYVKEQNNDP